jgi:hypothetical protein
MLLEFVGQSVRDAENEGADTSRLVNCYRSPLSDGRFSIKSSPGMKTISELPGAMLRAFGTVAGVLYVVHGGRLYSVEAGGGNVDLGAIPDSPETTIAGNNGKVTICAAGRYFVWDGATLSEPTPGAFSAFGSVEFLSSRTVLTERGGRRIQWSDLLDPETLPGTAFATTESRDDNNIRAVAFGPELWVFKETSIERWVPSGTGFQVLPGSTIDKGLKAFNLVCRMDTGGFFVGNDNKAYALSAGGELTRVSTPPVEASIARQDPVSAIYYQDEGHEFAAITFAGREAWVFDLTTGEWHERGEGNGHPWQAVRAGRAYGQFFVGNNFGNVFRLTNDRCDDDQPIIRRMVSKTLFMDSRFRVKEATFRMRTGFDGQVMMRTSRDRGFSWSAPKPRSLGATGQYETKVTWRNLGQFRNMTAEITIADEVDCPIESVANLVIA